MSCLGRIVAVGVLLVASAGHGPLGGGAAAANDVGSSSTAVTVAAGVGLLASPECFGREATIVGTAGDDVLVGTNGSDVIHGRGGDDLIRGLAGRDHICLGMRRPNRHNDSVLRGNRGDDHLRGSGGRLNGGLGDDVVKGVKAAVLGGAGNDSLLAAALSLAVPGPGRDRVKRGRLSYEDAKHPVRVDLARGRAYGQGMDILTGVHAVYGSEFGDVLKGDEHDNDLSSGGGNNTVYGRGGDDDIFSGDGNDTLYGRRGHDDLWDSGGRNDNGYGGPGHDSCQNIEHRFSCRVWHD